jgi:peptidoglycan-associated lipoprotein
MTEIRKPVLKRKLGRLAALALAAALLGGCETKKEALGVGGEMEGNGRAGYDGGPVTPGTARDFTVNVGDKVYFSTDSSELSQEARETLSHQAKWLNQYPNHTITIEGHSDERGTREYNIGLGAKRAQAVKEFLAQQGVSGARIRTISYGKERPVAMCNDISCWTQNRRGVTLLNNNSHG